MGFYCVVVVVVFVVVVFVVVVFVIVVVGYILQYLDYRKTAVSQGI